MLWQFVASPLDANTIIVRSRDHGEQQGSSSGPDSRVPTAQQVPGLVILELDQLGRKLASLGCQSRQPSLHLMSDMDDLRLLVLENKIPGRWSLQGVQGLRQAGEPVHNPDRFTTPFRTHAR
jgi:hypothetical protein